MSLQATLRPVPRFSSSSSSSAAASVCRQCLGRLRNGRETQPPPRWRSFSQSCPPRGGHAAAAAAPNASATTVKTPLRNVSGQKHDDNAQSLPRWAATPSAMKAPYRLSPKTDNDHFPVNENPERLDDAYVRIFGEGGEGWLSEEVKWLAVTHKSFDQGRRGYNERLAWFGKRMVYLQTTLALLNSTPSASTAAARRRVDGYGRRPFQDPKLHGIEDVSHYTKEMILLEKRLSHLAQAEWGLMDVVRWKPRATRDLAASGIDSVMCDAVYAIVGAVALSKGGEVANELIKRRILAPLMQKAPSRHGS